jgi:hypothetical protein
LNPINGALRELGSFFGLCAVLSDIASGWESIAGSALSRRSAVKSFDDGVLVVAVENRAAQQDMNFKKNAIIRAITEKTSLELSDIRAEIAPVVRPSRPAARRVRQNKRARAVKPLTPEIESMKEEIMLENPSLSEKIAESIAYCRQNRP